VKVKYVFVLYTGLSFAQIGNQNKGIRMKICEFCMILEYFSLEKGPFTGSWGRLEKFLPSLL
jgi:hypothetical protein